MNKKILVLILAALGCISAQSAHGWWGHGPYYGYGWGYGPYYGGPGLVGGVLDTAVNVATLGAVSRANRRYYADDAYQQGLADGRAQAGQSTERMDDRGPIYDNDNSRGDVTSTGRSAN